MTRRSSNGLSLQFHDLFFNGESLYMEREGEREGDVLRFLLRINIHERVTEDGVNRSEFRHRPVAAE